MQETEQAAGEEEHAESTDRGTLSEENSEEFQGGEREQAERQDAGGQDGKNDDNLAIDDTDDGPRPGEDTDAGGEEPEGDREGSGNRFDPQAGSGPDPGELSGEDAAASEAVEEFDQLGAGFGEDQEIPQGMLPDPEGGEGPGVSMIMMDQWLEQIEGDPANLLRNQFMIREQQEMQNYRNRLVETRPW
jgi:Ca-activated chloride channel family protein